MSVITSQQIQKYYDVFKSIDITLNKEVNRSLGFLGDQIFIKLLGSQWPCVLYSTSFESARIILSIKPDQMEKLRKGSNLGSLRYVFRLPDKTEPLAFFVNVRVKGFNKYTSESPDLYFMNLEFSQRPPDDLIEIVGRFLELNVNSKKRREERIIVNDVILKKMGFNPKNTIVFIDRVPRKCLLRDLSFGGAKILVPGVAKFLSGKAILLRLGQNDSGATLDIPGKFVRVESVDGRPDISVAAIMYSENHIPLPYKTIINDYLTAVKKENNEAFHSRFL